MQIEAIKHKLLIEGMYETNIMQDGTPLVYIEKNVLYTKEMYLARKKDMPLSQKLKDILDEIFNRDWTKYK